MSLLEFRIFYLNLFKKSCLPNSILSVKNSSCKTENKEHFLHMTNTWSCQFFVDLYSSFAILFILWEFRKSMTLDATVHLPNLMKFSARNVLYKFEMIGNYIFCKFFQHSVLSLFNLYQSFTISCLINNHLRISSVRNKKDNIPFRAYQQAVSKKL